MVWELLSQPPLSCDLAGKVPSHTHTHTHTVTHSHAHRVRVRQASRMNFHPVMYVCSTKHWEDTTLQ